MSSNSKKMSLPYRRLIIQAIAFSLIMTTLLFLLENDWALGDITASLAIDFLVWLLVGGFVSFFTWRAEGALNRKNEKWLTKRKQDQ